MRGGNQVRRQRQGRSFGDKNNEFKFQNAELEILMENSEISGTHFWWFLIITLDLIDSLMSFNLLGFWVFHC